MRHEDMSELQRLIEQFRDGELTAADAVALERELRADPTARAEFVSQCVFDVQIRRAAALAPLSEDSAGALPAMSAGKTASQPATSPARSRSVRNALIALASVAACVVVAVALWRMQPPHQPGPANTQVAAARVMETSGEVVLIDAAGKERALGGGEQVRPGERIRTQGEGSWVTLDLVDSTRLELAPDSTVRFPSPSDGDSRAVLENGFVQVHAAMQPGETSLTFSTAEARVIAKGGKFRLYKEAAASRVESEEGAVRFVRTADGHEVDVQPRSMAVATAKTEARFPVSEPLALGSAKLRHTFTKAGWKVAFSADGTRLAGSRGDVIKTWNVEDGKLVDTRTGHGDSRFGLTYAKDGTLLTLSDAKKLSLWDGALRNREEYPLMERDGSRDGAFSPDGAWLAIGRSERKMQVWAIDRTGPQHVRTRFEFQTKNNPNRVALSKPLAKGFPRLAYGQWNGPIDILDLGEDPPRPVREVTLSKTPLALALSDDGSHLATYSVGDGLQLWDMASGEHHYFWFSEAARVESLRFSADGKLLVAGFNDGTARVWSTRDGQSLLVLDVGCRTVRDVAFSPNSALLATAGDNAQVKIWECSFAPAPR
jgi:WD40 repeat protein